MHTADRGDRLAWVGGALISKIEMRGVTDKTAVKVTVYEAVSSLVEQMIRNNIFMVTIVRGVIVLEICLLRQIKLRNIGLLLTKIISFSSDLNKVIELLISFISCIITVVEPEKREELTKELFCVTHEMAITLSLHVIVYLRPYRSSVERTNSYVLIIEGVIADGEINDGLTRSRIGGAVEANAELRCILISGKIIGDLTEQLIYNFTALDLARKLVVRKAAEVNNYVSECLVLFFGSGITEFDDIHILHNTVKAYKTVIEQSPIVKKLSCSLRRKLRNKHTVGDLVTIDSGIISSE